MNEEKLEPQVGSGTSKSLHSTAVSVFSHSISAVIVQLPAPMLCEGSLVGAGVSDSAALGAKLGADEGEELGAADGAVLGANDGAKEGDALGASVCPATAATNNARQIESKTSLIMVDGTMILLVFGNWEREKSIRANSQRSTQRNDKRRSNAGGIVWDKAVAVGFLRKPKSRKRKLLPFVIALGNQSKS